MNLCKVEIRTQRIIVVRHDVCEGVRDISALNDLSRFSRLIRKLGESSVEIAWPRERNQAAYQEEREDDTANKEPFPNAERNGNATARRSLLATVEDVVRPI